MSGQSIGRTSRRAVVGAAISALGGSVVGRRARVRAQQSNVEESGDCEREPGVQLLVDWQRGNVVLSTEQLTPGRNWELYANPASVIGLIVPPGWQGELLFATEFSRTGEPRWTARQPPLHQLSSLRVSSLDGDAVFEYALGSIPGPPFSTDVAADVATQGIVGDADLRPVCAIDDPSNPVSANWFHADRVERSVLVTNGNAVGLPDTMAPATVVSYFSMLGPRRDFEELMGEVFIPLLFQFSGGGDGDGDGDGDDGGGDDGEDDDGDDGDDEDE